MPSRYLMCNVPKIERLKLETEHNETQHNETGHERKGRVVSEEKKLAALLVGSGVLTLLINLSGTAGWLWSLGLGIAVLALYLRRGGVWPATIGSLLIGITVGLWSETVGGFVLSVGIALWVVDRLEPSPSRWPLYPAAGLVSLGLLLAVAQSGVLSSIWFPVLLTVVGVLLWVLNSGDSDWTEAPPRQEPSPSRGDAPQ